MQTIEISPSEATLIQQGLTALQHQLNDSSTLPLLSEADWAQRFDLQCKMHLVHALTLKVSSPFVAFSPKPQYE